MSIRFESYWLQLFQSTPYPTSSGPFIRQRMVVQILSQSHRNEVNTHAHVYEWTKEPALLTDSILYWHTHIVMFVLRSLVHYRAGINSSIRRLSIDSRVKTRKIELKKMLSKQQLNRKGQNRGRAFAPAPVWNQQSGHKTDTNTPEHTARYERKLGSTHWLLRHVESIIYR